MASFRSGAMRLRARGKALLPWAHLAVPLAFLVLALAVRQTGVALVEDLQNRVFDSYQRLKPRSYEPAPVRIVDIDDETLERLGQWPWPRAQVAEVVRRLNELGTAVIAFDVVFAEPDRTAPREVLKAWARLGDVGALRQAVQGLRDPDRELARAVAKANVVTAFVLTDAPTAAAPAVKAGFAQSGVDPLPYVGGGYAGAVVTRPEIEKAAAGNGCFNALPDRDGIIRRSPLLFRLGDALVPSLAAEALRVAQGAANIIVRGPGAHGEKGWQEGTGIQEIRIGATAVPTDEQGRAWIYYTPSVPERTIPLWQIFEKGFDAGRVAESIVFVGTSAQGLKDQRATPLSQITPGVEVHAQLTEQALLKRFLRRPGWSDRIEILYMSVLGLALILLMPRVGAAWCAALAAGTIAGAFALSWRAFAAWQWLLDPVYPSVVILGTYLLSSLIGYLRSEAERRQVRTAFSRYMSPALVEVLAKHPERLKLGGETRNMTLLFCDIRGFTTISEQFDSEGLTRFINRYLTPMTQIILDHGGTIDKYMGDCIMAFWNAPIDDPIHARHACEAALGMRESLEALNSEWRAQAEAEGRKFIPIHSGVGLNTGDCCVGNMGSDMRFDYSVLGDDVNLASRLEGQSKTYGVDIVIGPKTREQAQNFAVLELDLLRVKGKTIPVHIYALLGDAALKEDEAFRKLLIAHHQMLSAYRTQEWGKARALLEECRKLQRWGLEPLTDLYAKRIEAYEARPPSPDWDGTFTATTK